MGTGIPMRPSASRQVALFGPFELDLKAGELHRDGHAHRLQEQPFLVLKMLLDRPGDVVTREEMRRTLWPNDTVVEFDQSINAAIKGLRQALNDSAQHPRFVETLARRGYRFKAQIATQAEAPPPNGSAPDTAGPAGAARDRRRASHQRHRLRPTRLDPRAGHAGASSRRARRGGQRQARAAELAALARATVALGQLRAY